jgi:hypothetical protein
MLPPEIEDGYFSGRSGNMILKPKNYKDPDSSIVFLDQTGNIFRNLKSEISIYNIADLIGRSFGISPMHKDFTASDYIKSNFFSRPMANLLIELDSIGDDLITDPNIGIKLNYLTSLRYGEINGFPMNVVETSYPVNYLSLATSLISGRKPSQHGIVGKMWKDADGSIIRGYSSKDSWSQVPSLLDIIHETFHGKSLIVSLSGDEQSAKVNSVNPRFRKSSNQDHIAYFRPNELDFKVSSGNVIIKNTLGELTARHIRFLFESTQDSILNLLRNHAGVDIVYNEGIISLHYTSKDGTRQEARFDPSLPEDMRLFSELQSSYSLVKVLRSPDVAPLIHDDSPDFFSISFKAINSLTEKYGQHSTQVIGALHLLDSTIPILFDRFSTLYPNRLLSEIVLLGSHHSTLSVENSQRKELISLFNRQDVFADLFPSLYIPREMDRTFSSELERIGFEVFSLPSNAKLVSHAAPVFVYFTEDAAPVYQSAQSGNVTSAEIAKYQIALWTSVLLIFVTVFAVYSLAFMSFKKDTLIYSTFNPKWETRQARN